MIFSVTLLISFLCFVHSQRFYVYDWPDLVNRYANFTDRDIAGHGVEFPFRGNQHHWIQNFGSGRSLHPEHMEHKTSQFGLFKILYERALRDKRRVLDPKQAQSFFIPYDFGMDASFLETNGRMRRTHCPLSTEVLRRLNQSEYFHRNKGHDHTLVVAINQNMNYFFGARGCHEILTTCWNCTKVSIDEYMFIAADRDYELRGRGINWHAVPFPSDYHYSTSNASVIPPWQRSTSRPLLISFTGNRRRYNEVSTLIRENLMDQCDRQPTICFNSTYRHGIDQSPNAMSRASVFCLQPPGDMPTRKSLFDAVLSGCIPVLFHPLTARFMYEWHLGQKIWDEIGIHYDTVNENHALLSQSIDFIEKLYQLSIQHPEIILQKQQKIAQVAYQLQYSLIWQDPVTRTEHVSSIPGQADAFDAMMNRLLAIHSGRETHDRVSDYLLCHYKLGAKGVKIQTAEWCNQTSSNIDPFYPSSTESPLYKVPL